MLFITNGNIQTERLKKELIIYLSKKLGTYKLTLTNSLGCTYTTTFKVLNKETPRIVSLTGKNDYYTIKLRVYQAKNSLF